MPRGLAESQEQKQVPVKVVENLYSSRCDDVCSCFEDAVDRTLYRTSLAVSGPLPMVESLDETVIRSRWSISIPSIQERNPSLWIQAQQFVGK